MSRRRIAVAAAVVLAVVAGTGAVLLTHQHASGGGDGTATGSATSTSTAPVVTTDVSRRQSVDGTLGRSGTFTVIAPGTGTLTWLPATGAVIGRGKPVYETDGRPVILLFGNRPPWRAFQTGMTDGTDVQQLEENLKALGYGAGLTVDQHFSSATYWAIRRWQKDSGLSVTGSVPLGQVVFVTGAVRISGSDLRTGTSVGPGTTVARGTSEQRAITVQVPTNVLVQVHVGNTVVVSIPDGSTKTGTVTSIGAVTQQPAGSAAAGHDNQGSSTQPTAPVVVTVIGEVSGVVEDVQVQVGITVELHRNVLAVPVPALRALPAGTYEVLVADGAQGRHVPVKVGIFDQVSNLVEISGTGLAAGQHVVVPGGSS